MSGSSSGLSDILSDLAAGRERPPRPDDPVDADAGPIAELDEAGPAHPRPRRRAARRSPSSGGGGGGDLKAAAVPVLLIVATLLLIPAVWSVLILTGTWESNRPDARTMALAMLACWPIALCMYAGAGWLYAEMRKSRRAREQERRR